MSTPEYGIKSRCKASTSQYMSARLLCPPLCKRRAMRSGRRKSPKANLSAVSTSWDGHEADDRNAMKLYLGVSLIATAGVIQIMAKGLISSSAARKRVVIVEVNVRQVTMASTVQEASVARTNARAGWVKHAGLLIHHDFWAGTVEKKGMHFACGMALIVWPALEVDARQTMAPEFPSLSKRCSTEWGVRLPANQRLRYCIIWRDERP
ncbi:hypothetical protein EV426DRAFT_640517 [Tirmania nivea]|nr:hypothetical protein EV426DRAFT_640517 [Tirmania nivea]